MKIYNKLIRDKIPEIIAESKNEPCVLKTLNEEEYLTALNEKLQEELNEYFQSGEIEELADLEEVLRAILALRKVDYQDFEKIRISKAQERGSFNKRLFLISVGEEN